MKKIILKISLFTVLLFFSQQSIVNAQKVLNKKTVNVHNNNFTSINTKNGAEKIQTIRDDKMYELTVVNEQVSAFSIDDKIIPKANWGEYSKEIAVIRQQLALDKIQAKKDQQQAQFDQQQVARDQKQVQKDQENVLLDQQQTAKDQQQAPKDQQQVVADQKLLNTLIRDLISDHIIPYKKALLHLTLNSAEMRVNGQEQPRAIFNRYREKYSRLFSFNFSYSNNAGVNK